MKRSTIEDLMEIIMPARICPPRKECDIDIQDCNDCWLKFLEGLEPPVIERDWSEYFEDYN